ncbi:MAG TPA: flagellar basal-body rod protein FlgG [Candidatus Adamsella sp.]|nr:flagellar basal-body rod protein FlgG [Candidatus Adamsella sp.]
MLRALMTAATGMDAQQLNIDVIANNVANVSTTGYKKVRTEFQSLLSQIERAPGALVAQGTNQPVGVEVGLGVKPSATQRVFTSGTIVSTGNSFDVAIEGDGFFRIQLDDGTIAYTRDGSFKVDGNGTLCTTDGYIVQPQITIPQDANEFIITSDGKVSVKINNEPTQTEIGTLELAKFINPAGLISMGKNLLLESPASGQPIQGIPGQEGFGTLLQSSLEGSNVQIVTELVNLIQAQRAFEANSNMIQSASEMLQQANQIR